MEFRPEVQLSSPSAVIHEFSVTETQLRLHVTNKDNLSGFYISGDYVFEATRMPSPVNNAVLVRLTRTYDSGQEIERPMVVQEFVADLNATQVSPNR